MVTQNLLQLTEVSDRFKEESLGSGNLKCDEQLPDVVCCRPDRIGAGAYNPDYAVPRICGDELCFILERAPCYFNLLAELYYLAIDHSPAAAARQMISLTVSVLAAL